MNTEIETNSNVDKLLFEKISSEKDIHSAVETLKYINFFENSYISNISNDSTSDILHDIEKFKSANNESAVEINSEIEYLRNNTKIHSDVSETTQEFGSTNFMTSKEYPEYINNETVSYNNITNQNNKLNIESSHNYILFAFLFVFIYYIIKRMKRGNTRNVSKKSIEMTDLSNCEKQIDLEESKDLLKKSTVVEIEKVQDFIANN